MSPKTSTSTKTDRNWSISEHHSNQPRISSAFYSILRNPFYRNTSRTSTWSQTLRYLCCWRI